MCWSLDLMNKEQTDITCVSFQVLLFSKACTVAEHQHVMYFWNRWQGARMGTWAILLWIWKCWTGGPKTLPSPLRLSLTHFHCSRNNKRTCALRYRADERAVLFFNRQKPAKLWPWYVLLDTTLWNNILKKRSPPPPVRLFREAIGVHKSVLMSVLI